MLSENVFFFVFYVFSFPSAVYVGTLNLIASIPGPSILTFVFGWRIECVLVNGFLSALEFSLKKLSIGVDSNKPVKIQNNVDLLIK